MRRLWPLFVLLSIALLATSARAANTEPFAFAPPAGWTDVLVSKSTAIPTEALLAIRGGNFVAFYMNIQPFAVSRSGFADNFNVSITDEVVRIDDAFLDRYEADFPKSRAFAALKATDLAVLEKSVNTIAGAVVARFVVGFTANGTQLRCLQYFMPSDAKMAILTYTTTADRFDGMLDTFEASAQATTGLQNPAWWRTYPLWARWGVLGACGGFVFGVLVLLKRRLFR